MFYILLLFVPSIAIGVVNELAGIVWMVAFLVGGVFGGYAK